ncbi:ABC transporter substrate-binding protein [Paenibacillus filicis]|uniref:ABC transporter substrate-binding protein n=1 Tax=Paenibacillus gyeongsangnamensis TaxID=3388067 RepID=A0ABT4Q9I8_9BACL|nr:ABC transporter substrate-binding protein [Paenibacillus filicis]MCZ8513493.1 ABC transporter substrate-binding protein [Paenibacillus filicis]
MLELQYLQLNQAYPGSAFASDPVEVTIADLISLWTCSERNVKMILKKLAALGYIEWIPGRGRGHASRLRCIANAQELLLEHARQSVHKGQLDEALLLDRFGRGQETKGQFMEWLSAYFGYQREEWDQQQLDTLRVPVFRPVRTLDPASTFYALEAHLVKQVYNTLVTYHPQRRMIEPQLAHYWEVSDDALEWKFYLRRGIAFHHGKELTAHDVAFTFRWLMDRSKPLPQRWLYEQLNEVRVLDNRAVSFHLNAPNQLFLRYLCFSASSVLPSDRPEPEAMDQGGLLPSGTGPFKLTDWSPNRCVLEAHRDYFEGRPHLDRVELTNVPEEERNHLTFPVLNSVLCIHGGEQGPRGTQGTDSDWEAIQLINDGCTMMTYNMKKNGPQQDVRFRKALHHLVDRGSLVQTLGENRRYPASGLQPHDYLVQHDQAYDPATARRLLEDMAYDGTPFRISTNYKHYKDALWIRDRCRDFGVVVEVTCYDTYELTYSEVVRETDAILYQFINDEGEVSLLELFLREDSFIRAHMHEEIKARVDKIAADLLSSASPDYRKHRLNDLEELLGHEHVVMFLLFKELNTFFNPSVRGVTVNSTGWIDFKNIWLQSV